MYNTAVRNKNIADATPKAGKDTDWNKSMYQWAEICSTCFHHPTRRVQIMNRIRNLDDGKWKGWTCTTYDGEDKQPRNILPVSADDTQW